jgi:hypothetical protein
VPAPGDSLSEVTVKRNRRPVPRVTSAASTPARPATVPFPGPAVRWSRVQSARARIAAEYYDRGEVRDRLVEALLSELEKR